ncbi:MAG: extracellular solute-binding protein [Lachnospiraceae bacterium]|nr:extracellular solute-binding protein [Lachnospiraceae bacterium]
MRRKMRGLLSLGLAFVMTASMLSGCGSEAASDSGTGQEESTAEASDQAAEDSGTADGAKAGDTAAEPITIQFWNSWTGADGELLTELVDEFNETNDSGITIEMDIMPSNDMSQKLATSVGAGTAAPLLLYNTAIKFSYGKEGELMNIDGIFERTNLKKEDFDAEVLKLGEFDGTDYFIPMQASTYYFFWNKDLFEEAGLDPETPPATWDEYEEIAVKLTDPDRNIYGSGTQYNSSYIQMCGLRNYGGEMITSNGDGTFTYNLVDNEGYAKYLGIMAGLIGNGQGTMEGGGDDLFRAGQAGMLVSGPWLLTGVKESGINYGIALMPGGDAGAYNPLMGAGFTILEKAGEEEKTAACKFIEWWFMGNDKTEKTAALRWSTEIGYPAFYAPIKEEEEYKSNNDIVVMSGYGDSAVQFTPVDYPQTVAFGADVVAPLMENVCNGGDITQALKDAQAAAEAIPIN